MTTYRKFKDTTLSHLVFTTIFLKLLLFGVTTASAQDKEKPNILFVISCDLTTNALGDTDVATPKMAEIMAQYYW